MATCTGILAFREENEPIGDAFTTALADMLLKTLSAQGIVQKQAVSSKDPPRSIIGKALKEVSKEAWGRIRRSFVTNNIRSIRHQNKLEPANPKSLELLVVPKSIRCMAMKFSSNLMGGIQTIVC